MPQNLDAEVVIDVYDGQVLDVRSRLHLVLLVGIAVLFIPLWYIVRAISEDKAMDILQIVAVLAVEIVRVVFKV
jgi:hypothetical protein